MTRPRTPLTPAPPPGQARPGSRCPAIEGAGADIHAAGFTLVAEDCERGPDRRPTMTDVFGYFRLPGPEHDDDAVLTASLTVPVGSPIARLAHQVTASAERVRQAGDTLRQNVRDCPCGPALDCPALDEVRLVEAIEHAAG